MDYSKLPEMRRRKATRNLISFLLKPMIGLGSPEVASTVNWKLVSQTRSRSYWLTHFLTFMVENDVLNQRVVQIIFRGK